jgi:alpha-amylase
MYINRMRMKQWQVTMACLCSLMLPGCGAEIEEVAPIQQDEIIVTELSKDSKNGKLPGPGGGVLMQAFYWDVPSGGTWWNTVNSKLTSWDAAGISAIWLPPASKAQNGAFSMGYDPFDYYDFGNYNQMGSTETRFGSRTELTTLITNAHAKNIQVYADIVLNHNSGGASEANPRTGGNTWTRFNPLSGKFPRTYNDFHPSSTHANDEGAFGGFPDLCHHQANVSQWLWVRTDAVSKYYKNTMKFDGWRFDYVKGFAPWVVKDFVNSIGGFAVGENWDGNASVLKSWVDGTARTSSAFDFACYYRMDEAFDGNNLNILNSDMLWKRDAAKAVTFVTNHDTDIIWDKMLAYAYILTHEGYPTIFYRDYEEWLNKAKMNNLIWVKRTLAGGSTTIRFIDTDEYIASRNGYGSAPGLLVYINDSDTWKEQWVNTPWANTQIKEYTGASSWVPTTAGDTRVKIQAPPHSYSVWSKTGY